MFKILLCHCRFPSCLMMCGARERNLTCFWTRSTTCTIQKQSALKKIKEQSTRCALVPLFQHVHRCSITKVGHCSVNILGGRICVFASSIGSLGKGSVTNRLNKDLFNKPEEGPKIMMPANNFYQNLAAECNSHRICVDLFYGLNDKITVDLATVVPVCGMTGGELTFY
jgi:hypothetical protein